MTEEGMAKEGMNFIAAQFAEYAVETKRSFFEISFVLHCFTMLNDPFPRRSTPAGKATIEMFLAMELIATPVGEIYRLTERGRAYLELLRQVPFPDIAYIDPRNGERVYG